MKSYEARLVALARTFPELHNAPLEPWDADKLDAWAAPTGSGCKHAVRFILSVYNSNYGLPAARVRRQLLEEFEKVYDQCCRLAPVDEGTEAQRKRAHRADTHADRARELYCAGNREKAHKVALQAAELHNGWERLANYLKVPRVISEADVLAKIHKAEAFRVGPFSVHDALGTWDDAHRAAFAAWLADPWWA